MEHVPKSLDLSPESLLAYIEYAPEHETPTLHHSLPTLALEDMRTLVGARGELSKVSPRHFEQLVAELLRADGYEEVMLIPRLNAPGPDIVAVCRGPSGQKQEYIVECKRWKDAVGLDVVRDVMYRVDTERRATGAIIVTTSQFTQSAIEEAKSLHQWRLTLKDGQAVREWAARQATVTKSWQIKTERVRRLRDTLEGAATLSILQNPHVHVSMRSALVSCSDCGGPLVCGRAQLGAPGENMDALFHLCLICMATSYFEVGSLTSFCSLCRESLKLTEDEILLGVKSGGEAYLDRSQLVGFRKKEKLRRRLARRSGELRSREKDKC